MSLESFISYLLVTIIAVATPGPLTFISINYGVSQGIKKGVLFILGTTIGVIMLIIISSVGVGAIVSTSVTFASGIKIFGIVVLFYISIKMIQSYMTVRKMDKDENNIKEKVMYKRDSQVFKEGTLLVLGNPQTIIFFASIFPQYMSHDSNDQFVQLLILGVIFVFFHFTVLSSFPILSSTFLKNFFASKKKMSVLNLSSGIALMIMSLYMLFTLVELLW